MVTPLDQSFVMDYFTDFDGNCWELRKIEQGLFEVYCGANLYSSHSIKSQAEEFFNKLWKKHGSF